MGAPTYLPAWPCREVVQGGEAFDGDVLQLVGRGVQLSDDDVLVVLVALAQLLPGSRHRLAVGAPRCICGTGAVPGDEPGDRGSAGVRVQRPQGEGLVMGLGAVAAGGRAPWQISGRAMGSPGTYRT